MSAIVFPTNPEVGDVFTAGGRTWTYNGIGWAVTSTSSGVVSATAPATYNPTTQVVGVSGTTAEFNASLTDGDFATLAGSETLSNKILRSPEEDLNILVAGASGTINFDVMTSGVWYFTGESTENFIINFRGNSSTTLDSVLAVGDSISVVLLNTNGATAYYPSAVQIDGSAVTPKWSGGSAPTGGNASSVDGYSFTIVKTDSTPTYVVLGAQAKFA